MSSCTLISCTLSSFFLDAMGDAQEAAPATALAPAAAKDDISVAAQQALVKIEAEAAATAARTAEEERMAQEQVDEDVRMHDEEQAQERSALQSQAETLTRQAQEATAAVQAANKKAGMDIDSELAEKMQNLGKDLNKTLKDQKGKLAPRPTPARASTSPARSPRTATSATRVKHKGAKEKDTARSKVQVPRIAISGEKEGGPGTSEALMDQVQDADMASVSSDDEECEEQTTLQNTAVAKPKAKRQKMAQVLQRLTELEAHQQRTSRQQAVHTRMLLQLQGESSRAKILYSGDVTDLEPEVLKNWSCDLMGDCTFAYGHSYV